jgi:hypothetical protein
VVLTAEETANLVELAVVVHLILELEVLHTRNELSLLAELVVVDFGLVKKFMVDLVVIPSVVQDTE